MNIRRWPKEGNADRQAGQMLRCSPEEAVRIIASLSRQLVEKDGNAGRAEFVVGCGVAEDEYFSIAVDFRAKPEPAVSLREAAQDLANHLAGRGFSCLAIGYDFHSIIVREETPKDIPVEHLGYPVVVFTRDEGMPPITRV